MADDSETTKKTKKVMVAIDESDCSRYALQWALENLHDKLQSSGLVVFTSILVDFGGIYAATYGSARKPSLSPSPSICLLVWFLNSLGFFESVSKTPNPNPKPHPI